MNREDVEDIAAKLDRQEYTKAHDSCAVYAGLHLPDQLEEDPKSKSKKLVHYDPDEKDVGLKPSIAKQYVPALHHRIEIDTLEKLESGEKVDGRVLDRLLILAPPGSAKSTYASVIFPAWFMGRNPKKSVIAASQTQDLADRFGRRCRNLVASQTHREVFGTGIARDQRAAGAWETEKGGEYKAVGVAPFAGRRADLVICDDLIRGYKDADSPTVRESTWNWILGDLRPRMKPNAKWVYITTRWHSDDPVGRILPESWNGKSGWIKAKDGEWWYVLSFVAIVETEEEEKYDPCKRKIGEILWKEWYTLKMLNQERRSQGRRNWNALYQQKPQEDEGGILKAMWWRKWEGPLPLCEYLISVYDTAMEEGEENDYSARTDWGIFEYEEKPEDPNDPDVIRRKKLEPWYKPPTGKRLCCILLGEWQDKVEFPELRKLAKRHYRESKPRPDRILVEKKVSGHSLIQELRRSGVPVKAVKADKSKKARAHAAAVPLEDGCVWYVDRKWSDKVIDRCARASFVKGDPGNDQPDTVVHALNFLRKGFFLETKDHDEKDEDEDEYQESTTSRLFN